MAHAWFDTSGEVFGSPASKGAAMYEIVCSLDRYDVYFDGVRVAASYETYEDAVAAVDFRSAMGIDN